jgi:hypothetical protein
MLLAGCSPEPPPPTLTDLHFPVAVLYSNASTRLCKDASELGVMGVQLMINSNSPPVLIDSDFNIFTLEKLRSTHGDLWLMLHPSGDTEVAFDLKRAPKSGLDAARAAMRAELEIQTWRTDMEKRRKTIATQTTLSGMMEVLRDDEG